MAHTMLYLMAVLALSNLPQAYSKISTNVEANPLFNLKRPVSEENIELVPVFGEDDVNLYSPPAVYPFGPWGSGFNCTPGFLPLHGIGCYKFVNLSFGWEEARSYCELIHGYLAVPSSPEEFNELRIQMSILYEAQPWIGIHKYHNSWIGVNGRPIYLKWARNQPSSSGLCVGLSAYGMKDFKCSATGSFICEGYPM